MSEKCSPDDPHRCQGVTPNGQCEYLATPGEKYCNYHSQGRSEKRLERKTAERYLIDDQILRQAYIRQRGDDQYLDLKEEISLLSALVQRRLNVMKTDADVITTTNAVTTLLQRLESMKISLLKLQQQLGLVLGKAELRTLAAEIANILDQELDGLEDKEERMDRLCERLFIAIESAGRKEEGE